MNHTPGPWAWGGEPGLSELSAAGGKKILDYVTYEGMWLAAHDDKVDAANARLIAAAPDLLAALRAVTAHCESLRDFVCEGGSIRMVGARQAVNEADDAINNAHAVIAEAGGE